MTGAEFLRKVKRLAVRRGLSCRWVPAHGQGSHGTLYLGASGRTTVKHLTKEIAPGLLHAMCRQLKISVKDL